jgi:hypothetical protein
MIYIFIVEFLVRISIEAPDVLFELFHDFPQPLQDSTGYCNDFATIARVEIWFIVIKQEILEKSRPL